MTSESTFFIDTARARHICKMCLWLVQKLKRAKQNVREVEKEIEVAYNLIKEFPKGNTPARRQLRFHSLATNELALGPNLPCSAPEPSFQKRISQELGLRLRERISSSSTQNLLETIQSFLSSPPIHPYDLNLQKITSTPARGCEGNFEYGAMPHTCGTSCQKTLPTSLHKIPTDVECMFTVKWSSCQRSKALSEDLHQICKKVLRGRYDNLASAVWNHGELRKHIIKIFLKHINKACENLCLIKKSKSSSENNQKRFTHLLI